MIMFELIAKNYHVNVMIKQKRKILFARYHEKTHSRTRRASYQDILNIIFLTSIKQKFNLTLVELEWSCSNLSQKIITLTWWSNKNEKFFSHVIMKEHIREHNEHHIETFWISYSRRASSKSLIWRLSNLNDQIRTYRRRLSR